MGRTLPKPAAVRRLEALYRRHHRRVRWVLRGRGIAEHELDDGVHEVFLALHRRESKRDPALSEELWVVGVARNVAFSVRRGQARRLRMLDDAPGPDPERSLDDELGRREAWHALESFLGTLPEDQREAFILMDLWGMSTAEIADLTGAPANTVSSRVRLARGRFRRSFPRPEDDAKFLREAARQSRPSRERRRRTLAGIVAALPVGMVPEPSSTGLGSTVGPMIAGAVAAAVVIIGVRSVVVDDSAPSTERAQPTARAEPTKAKVPSPAPAEVAAAMPDADPVRPTEQPRVLATDDSSTSPTRRPAGAPRSPEEQPETPGPSAAPPPVQSVGGASPTTDSLIEAVTMLRRAESQLAAGDASAALASLDAYRERFDLDPLRRDQLRIERRAACATGQTARATRAHGALARAGLVDANKPVCP
ncbi:MAG: sigma-70 family RNA polymerase sigma factor [Myxococcota bacterium]